MFRIIYCEPGKMYQTIDSHNEIEIIANEGLLKCSQCKIICVINYSNQLILNKSSDFDIHRELIDEIIFDPKIIG
jgi:ferredoxin-like protein FixX